MSALALDTPILFLLFRNPECTQRVFEQIRAARPTRLFISADGPRLDHPTDQDECQATREVVANIDWDCEVQTRFLSENLGLKKAVSTAIDWFFEHVNEGIILEYDCLPDPSFFPFCEAMLERYRDDVRISSVTGNNLQADIHRGDGDYYYSRITGIWGWATWKRSWQRWRPFLDDYDIFKSQSMINSIVIDEKARQFWIRSFDAIQSGENTTTWAFCYVYAQMKQGAYCITPNNNLVENIGFSEDGTNALDPTLPIARLTVTPIKTYNGPTFFVPDIEADTETTLRAAYTPPNPLYKRIPRFALRKIQMIFSPSKLSKTSGIQK